MLKKFRPHWFLHTVAKMEVERLAPGSGIIACIQYDDSEIVWDDECIGLGTVAWHCGYLLPDNDVKTRELLPMLKNAMIPWQSRYDLGLTSD